MLPNLKRQHPIHIACQSREDQPQTLVALHQRWEDRDCFSLSDSDGMSPLHHACQRTNHVDLVTSILSYKKDNINTTNLKGMTALDLVSRRGQETDQRLGLHPIDPCQQANIIKLLKNNGAKSSQQVTTTTSSSSSSSSSPPQPQSYEDQMASQVLQEFPELSGLLEQFIDGNK